ncbi:MAG: Cys-Gln thioester bond-forming surface protein, partial [Clostridia bacterium]|nr:Cys-Gln thioester bond-forming surface protein [Clostridia bacterium]
MKAKKLIGAILIFTAVLLVSIFSNNVDAASLGYVTITKDRKVENITYKHQLYTNNTANIKNVWKLVTCNQDGTITNTLPDIYCLRAGLGFTSESLDHTVVEYNQSYDMMRQYQNLVNYFSTLNSETTIFNADNTENFNAVMWVLDNMILEGATEEQVIAYLKNYAGYTDERLNALEEKENVLTRADIEAIQQLVIWYFTNKDEEAYNKETLPPIYLSVTGSEYFDTGKDELTGRDKYETFADIYDGYDENGMPVGYGRERQERANTLYRTLIAKAKEAAQNGYKPTRDITIYLAGTNAAEEQPIVRVREHQKEVDVALRKFISKINGEELTGDNSREPVVDTSKLNKVVDGKLQTTAIYNHSKKPLKVDIGDTITYTLRVYNEGEIDTYIKEITDYLPAYLEYVAHGNDDGTCWLLDEATGRIAISTEFCKVTGVGGNIPETEIGKKLGEVLLPAAEYDDPTDKYTLSYVDVEISCKVMTKAPYDKNITNIAQITKLTDETGKNLDQDRDSVPKDVNNGPDDGFTLPEDEKLPDYTGGKNGKNDPYYDGSNKTEENYYPGQEDDDDFEKIYIEAPVIDLALRKFISQIGDTKYDRAPVVDTSGLKQGAETAIYNHSKMPIQVEVGDIVTYTLRIYNEGDVNGKVTQVTDYLAKYLTYVPGGNDKNGDWWKQTTGEKYNTVVSNENCKIVNVGGATDKAYVGKNLGEAIIPAYDKEKDVLSYIDIEIHCKVLPVDTKTKVTNIAEITGETDEYGNPVDKDRDSEPGNVKLPEDFPGYKDNESDKPYVPGQQDDDDFEKIVIKPQFDLALRKFITKVGEVNVNNRYPEV